MYHRSAFTMIELIFAIVIIAITVISLPMMLQVTSKGMKNNLAQEAIFAASTQLNQSISYKWNGNAQESVGGLSKVVFTSGDCNATTKLRKGHVHRMCLNDTSLTPNLTVGVNPNQSDYSINNASRSDVNIFSGAGSASGYKENYKMDVAVSFAGFGAATAANQNIKEVKITIKREEPFGSNTYIDYVVLRTFSANIGETESAKRLF